MPLQILAAHVAFSATGLLLGLVIALIVYVVALLVARETPASRRSRSSPSPTPCAARHRTPT
jgi:hypothetical protein